MDVDSEDGVGNYLSTSMNGIKDDYDPYVTVSFKQSKRCKSNHKELVSALEW